MQQDICDRYITSEFKIISLVISSLSSSLLYRQRQQLFNFLYKQLPYYFNYILLLIFSIAPLQIVKFANSSGNFSFAPLLCLILIFLAIIVISLNAKLINSYLLNFLRISSFLFLYVFHRICREEARIRNDYDFL